MSLSIAAGLGLGGNENYSDRFQPFGGLPDGAQVIDGHIELPDLVGIGFECKSTLIDTLRRELGTQDVLPFARPS